jgi:glycerol uptake facilitator-like aquaporin
VIASTGGFQAIANIFAFSSVSGAHFNPAISFALWLTGKLSNRKLAGYVAVQLLASIIAMCIIAAIFYSKEMSVIYAAVAVQPLPHVSLGKVFATEFFLTFILTYVAFTVVFEDAEARKKETMSIKGISDSVGLTLYASTPQSKTGFAPFSIGLTIFSLSLIGGSSCGAFNPARLFGPAIFSGAWKNLWLYWLAEFSGSASAGLMVHAFHGYGLQNLDEQEEELGLAQLVKDLGGRRSEFPPINPLVTSSITEV